MRFARLAALATLASTLIAASVPAQDNQADRVFVTMFVEAVNRGAAWRLPLVPRQGACLRHRRSGRVVERERGPSGEARRAGRVSLDTQADPVTLPKKPEGRRRFLDEEELRRLLAACEGVPRPAPGSHRHPGGPYRDAEG
jgi:hypothetical protein